jgi:hypothetical protein
MEVYLHSPAFMVGVGAWLNTTTTLPFPRFAQVLYMEDRRSAYRVLMERPEGKRPLRRPRVDWRIMIKMVCQEVGCGSMVWIDQAQDRDR